MAAAFGAAEELCSWGRSSPGREESAEMSFALRSPDRFATFFLYLGSPRFQRNQRALPALSGF
jgi:hypothetical protein